MARTYVTWGIAHPGAYQLLFESADVLPEELTADGPGVDLLERVGDLAAAHGVSRADSSGVALRIWVGLHGIVSLRMHKPAAPWATSAEADSEVMVSDLLGSEG
jgi:hypothetical protein